MADFMGHEQNFTDYNTHGGGDGDEEDMDEVVQDDFFAGGAKAVNERSFTVEKADIGSFSGGRFISTSSYNAAKKAATAIFRHIDVESGVAKPRKQAASTKNGREVTVNRILAQRYTKKNPVSQITFVLHRIDRQNPQKYYAYTAERLHASKPKIIRRGDVDVAFNHVITVKQSDLSDDYVALNAQLSKDFNAAKRAAKRRAENPDKPLNARKPKAPKAPKAAKAAKDPKAAKAAKAAKAPKAAKKITVADIIKSLSMPVKPVKAPKAPKAPKTKTAKPKTAKPKAAKKTTGKAPRKALFGGGACSFF